MTGHLEVINLLQSLHSIIIFVGKKPDWYKPHEMNGKGERVGLIYTENSRPKKNDLWFGKNKDLQLLHGTCSTDELFSKWFAEAVNCKPKSLLAVDSEMEIYVNR